MEEAVNSIRPPKREVIVIDYEESTSEQPPAKSAKRDEQEERTSSPRSPASSTFTAVEINGEVKEEEEERISPPRSPMIATFTAVERDGEIKKEEEIDMEEESKEKTPPPGVSLSSPFTAVERDEEVKEEEESDLEDESKEKSPPPGAPISSTFTAVPGDGEVKEEEIDMEENPPKKSPDLSPEVIELRQKVRRLEQKLEGASVVARAAELRAEAAENKLSLITAQLKDSKRDVENSRKVIYDLTAHNQMFKTEMTVMKNERTRDRARIDELGRRFAMSELCMKVQKHVEVPIKRPGILSQTTHFASTLTCARIRPFHSNSALLPPLPPPRQIPVVAVRSSSSLTASREPLISDALTSTSRQNLSPMTASREARQSLPSPMASIIAAVRERTTPVSVEDQMLMRGDAAVTGCSPSGVVETGPSPSASRGGAMDGSGVTGVAAALAHHLATVTPTPRLDSNRYVILPKSTVMMGKVPKSTQTPEVFLKKRIGRPPKTRDDQEAFVKRPPGRPPKARDDGSKATTPSATEGVTKRRPGRPSKERDNHWSEMKRAQATVIVKKSTDNPEDWTAFDAFLRRNYQRLSASYNEKPSNDLALKIKRTLWRDLTREGVPSLWEEDAARFRAEGKKREYWGSETVIEQDDRVVEDGVVGVVPLGGEKMDRGDSIDDWRIKKENGEASEMPEESLQEEKGEEEDATPQWITDSVAILEELMGEPCARHFTTKDTNNEELAKVWKNCDDLKTLCEKVRGREMDTPKDVKTAVNAFVAKANYLIANRKSEIYQDMVKLQHLFNHRYRSVLVEYMSTTATVGANSRVCIDRSSRRRSNESTPNGNNDAERADPSLSAAESDDDQPSTSSSSRRAARHKKGFYRTLDQGGSIG